MQSRKLVSIGAELDNTVDESMDAADSDSIVSYWVRSKGRQLTQRRVHKAEHHSSLTAILLLLQAAVLSGAGG